MSGKRWGLKHEGRDFIVHQETREEAVELFIKEIGNVFRLAAPPSDFDIAAAVYELGPNDLIDGRVLVDKNPARETRQAHVSEPPAAEATNGPGGAVGIETTLEQIRRGANGVT